MSSPTNYPVLFCFFHFATNLIQDNSGMSSQETIVFNFATNAHTYWLKSNENCRSFDQLNKIFALRLKKNLMTIVSPNK